MDFWKCISFADAPSTNTLPANFINRIPAISQFEERERADGLFATMDVHVDLREVYFLIMHFLSTGPCQKTFRQFLDELQEHELLPRRYHAWYSRSGVCSGDEEDDGVSFPLNYDSLVSRYPHVEDDHLVKLLKQLMLRTAPPLQSIAGRNTPTAIDVPTLLGAGPFSLLCSDRNDINKQAKHLPAYLRWPHMQADQVRGLSLREIGGGFSKHHRAPSIRFACYAVAKPSTMVQKMQNIKRLRGHRAAVYCAIFDRSGRYVITGSDDRLVKIWSMETGFCLSSCRGHEGDITDLAVSSNNVLVASASNDYSIRVWRLPDGFPVSVLVGHAGAVTAIAFSPRASCVYQLLSSSDDGTCRIWNARSSQCSPHVYLPKPVDAVSGKSSGVLSNGVPSSSNTPQYHHILCCAYNSSGTFFVTGSSDTYARVWSACKSNSDDPEQPSHEIDLLAGHENDVNYVQFSGCAVASRTSLSDFSGEDNFPKFKNSWFSQDNIVTCSRDGSAIIWTPKVRRSSCKGGRWVRAYHLKVPPPPMPPQPPRGGPRQRLLPTPRGVNMIVWSLDNRFVLAAIMDCRICVWNASDGSLVHSLTGHTASTYVLDVHPFNPRIAMSAGYDGKTILWDIWEGIPIWVYEIGRFKLVDGKFSQDGTSIVLSDDVGQIYLLNTGQGESQKDAKYDQFFLGDYRPLVQDAHGNIIDQETQLSSHQRNIQDLLCDSSMLPYPEPYQTVYQRRRLGALKIEWRPSSIKFAVGPDIGLGQEYQVLPLADLDMVVEPLPEFLEALYLEPENDGIHDETDSEYFLTDEFSSEDEQECSSGSSSNDSEKGEDDKVGRVGKNGLRRSKRKNPLAEVELTTSGRRVRKRFSHELEGTSSRSRRTKKLRNRRKNSSKRESAKVKSSRPQRVSARNAVNGFSQISEVSTDGDEEDDSESGSSETESSLQGTNIKSKKPLDNSHNMKQKYLSDEQASLHESKRALNFPKRFESHTDGENRKRLVLKFSIRNSAKPLPSESTSTQPGNHAVKTSFPSGDSGAYSGGMNDSESAKDCRGCEFTEDEVKSTQEDLKTSTGNEDTTVRWGEVKLRTAKRMQPGDSVDSCHRSKGSSNLRCETRSTDDCIKRDNECGNISAALEIGSSGGKFFGEGYREKQECEANALQDVDDSTNNGFLPLSAESSSLLNEGKQNGSYSGFLSNQSPSKAINVCGGNELVVRRNQPPEPNEIPKRKPTILKIKSKMVLQNSTSVEVPARNGSDLVSRYPFSADQNVVPSIPEGDRSHFCEGTSSAGIYNQEVLAEFPDIATDAMRRKRSLRLKATSRETNILNHNYRNSSAQFPMRSLRSAEKLSKRTLTHFPTRAMPASKPSMRTMYSKQNDEYYHNGDRGSSRAQKNSPGALSKANWLLLSEQEEGYRYIPQLGDEVVYIVQGHEEYIESSQSLEKAPSKTYRGKIRAVEVCLVEDLQYSFHPGSGESCCKITLKLIDSSSALVGHNFQFTLSELIDFPDFVVEKTRYDAAMNRNWTCRDKCLVWWRDDSEEGGSWWEGRIVSLKDKSSDFPDSPWERFEIKYKSDGDSSHHHSPWELHDPESSWEHPQIEAEIRNKILSSFNKLLLSASRDEDQFGILKLEEISQRESFINRFPVPLSLGIMMSRLENNYYRSLKAIKHDITVMLNNVQSYNGKQKELSMKMKRLSDWFSRKLSKF